MCVSGEMKIGTISYLGNIYFLMVSLYPLLILVKAVWWVCGGVGGVVYAIFFRVKAWFSGWVVVKLGFWQFQNDEYQRFWQPVTFIIVSDIDNDWVVLPIKTWPEYLVADFDISDLFYFVSNQEIEGLLYLEIK